jgi:hypothetical protein
MGVISRGPRRSLAQPPAAVEHPDRGPATDGRHGQEAALTSTDELHSTCFGVNVIRRFEALKLRIDIALEQA